MRALVAAAGVALTVLILKAIGSGDFSAAGNWLTTDPWGIVTLADLYFGLFIAALAMALFEKGKFAVFWILPLPFLGNVWTALWVFVRFPELVRRLRG